MKLFLLFGLWSLMLLGTIGRAQEPDTVYQVEQRATQANADQGGASNTELAKATQNPVADLISVPFQNNANLDWGVDGEWENTLNIQPVWPFRINDDWNLITRTILPVKSQPARINANESRKNGLGDTTFTAFFSPSDSGKFLWGVGPVALIPTATDDRLGCDCWGLGPSVVGLVMPGKWVIGGLISQVWDVSDSNDPRKQIDLLTIQPFINYNLNDGWYLTSAPILTRNNEALSGEEWLIPIGGGAGKVFKVGRLPLNASAQFYYNVVRPEQPLDVGRRAVRLQLQLIFPK